MKDLFDFQMALYNALPTSEMTYNSPFSNAPIRVADYPQHRNQRCLKPGVDRIFEANCCVALFATTANNKVTLKYVLNDTKAPRK
jgi:hypothetical protein